MQIITQARRFLLLFDLPCPRPLMLCQVPLAQADILWGYLDQLIVIDEVKRLFQAHQNWRRQTHGDIGGRGAYIRLLLLFTDVDNHVGGASIQADDHSLVDWSAGFDEG